MTDPVSEALEENEPILWREHADWRPLLIDRLANVLVFLLFMLVFSIVSLVALVSVATMAWRVLVNSSFDLRESLVILPVLLLGLFFSVSAAAVWWNIRELHACWATHYVLTERRLLIVSPLTTDAFELGEFIAVDAFDTTICLDKADGESRFLRGVRDPQQAAAIIRDKLAPPPEREADAEA